MNKIKILITGVNGEIGHALILQLAKKKAFDIVALDVRDLADHLKPFISKFVLGSVLNKSLISSIIENHKIQTIFHLAAILSAAAEEHPETAHQVNVGGTLNLLLLANKFSNIEQRNIKLVFPSTIAVYGLPNISTKKKEGAISEDRFNKPLTIYGINKLYCEQLGYYYSEHYRQLSPKRNKFHVDFRVLRFPGIISAKTVPSGGTSDYAPEMLHSAAGAKDYTSFVRPETTIPFMVMPDVVNALMKIAKAPASQLKHHVYNVSGFSAQAKQIAENINKVFPDTKITYQVDMGKQKIVDSWPDDINDSRAKSDWGWTPEYNLKNAFDKYLIPEIKKQYE